MLARRSGCLCECDAMGLNQWYGQNGNSDLLLSATICNIHLCSSSRKTTDNRSWRGDTTFCVQKNRSHTGQSLNGIEKIYSKRRSLPIWISKRISYEFSIWPSKEALGFEWKSHNECIRLCIVKALVGSPGLQQITFYITIPKYTRISLVAKALFPMQLSVGCSKRSTPVG